MHHTDIMQTSYRHHTDIMQVLDSKGAKYVVETMWMLMEANLEEVS